MRWRRPPTRGIVGIVVIYLLAGARNKHYNIMYVIIEQCGILFERNTRVEPPQPEAT